MKKIVSLALVSLALVSCGSKTPSPETTTLWQSGSLSLNIPKNWGSIESKDVVTPANGKFIAGFRGSESYGEFENLNIVSEDIVSPISSTDYADTSFVLMNKKLASATTIKTTKITFSDGSTSRLRIFEGKYNTTTNLKRYVQTARICNMKAYMLTFTLSALNKDNTEMEKMLSSFNCAQPETK